MHGKHYNDPNYKKAGIPLAAQGFLIALCTAPIILPFAYANQATKGENTWLITMIIAGVVRVRWELRGHLWFWVTTVLVTAAHIPVILWAPWTNVRYLGYAMAPFILIDFAAVYGVVKFVEVLFERDHKSSH